MIKIKVQGRLPVELANDHMLYVFKDGSFHFVRADKVTRLDKIAIPILAPPSSIFPIEVLKRHLSINLAEFFGFYLAEGSADRQGHVRLSFGKHEQKLVSRVKLLCEKLFKRKVIIIETPTSSRVSFVHRPFAKFLREQFSILAKNKQIPYWLIGSSRDLLIPFMIAYELGDGEHSSNVRISFATASRTLAYQLQTVMSRLGIYFNISLRRGNGLKFGQKTSNGKHAKNDLYVIYSSQKEAFKLFNKQKRNVKNRKHSVMRVDNYWVVPIKETACL